MSRRTYSWLRVLAGLLVVTLIPELDEAFGIFRGLVGFFAVHHVGLAAAVILCLLSGVLAWIASTRTGRGMFFAVCGFSLCAAACAGALVLRADGLSGWSFPGTGEVLYICMLTSLAFAVMSLVSTVSATPGSIPVFLSSTTQDLHRHREAVYRAIQRLDGFTCIRMEDAS